MGLFSKRGLVREGFGEQFRDLKDALHALVQRVDRLESERIERYAAWESAVDKLIAVTMRQKKRMQKRDEAAELTDAEPNETNPLTGQPLDPISAAIHARRRLNGTVRHQD